MNQLFYFLIVVIMLNVIILPWYIAIKHFKALKANRELIELELQIKTPITRDVNETIENFIEDIFNEYILLNTEYIKDIYITAEKEQEIAKDVIDKIGDSLSPTMFQQLSVYYNKDYIPTFISEKVYEFVMMYAMDKNAPKQDKEELE